MDLLSSVMKVSSTELVCYLFDSETSAEDRHENWNKPQNWSHLMHQGQQVPSLPTQLPAGAGLPSCTGDYTFGFFSLYMSSNFFKDFNLILSIFTFLLGTLGWLNGTLLFSPLMLLRCTFCFLSIIEIMVTNSWFGNFTSSVSPTISI